MGHDDEILIGFLNGSLDGRAREDFDAHLLACEECWKAIQEDRRGRQAAEGLRELAPPALRDRVRLAIEVASGERPGARRRTSRTWPALVAGCMATLVMLTGLVVFSSRRSEAKDPAVVAAVVSLARAGLPGGPQSLVVDGQRLAVGRLRLEGRNVVVAVSDQPFPMPLGGRALAAGEDAPMAATRGRLGVVCLSRPVPMLVTGRLSPDRLAVLAAHLSPEEIPAISGAHRASLSK